ncbi:hypothetical protein NIES25_52430 [Nostoc linckia NIES-25]|nr:hypothetical protein NIES25_52430 [Nostoc linckia NIES-25]
MIKFLTYLINLNNYFKKDLDAEQEELEFFYIWCVISFLTVMLLFYKVPKIYNYCMQSQNNVEYNDH